MPVAVSIHAPREGRDLDSCLLRSLPPKFQSTRPVKGATGRLALAEFLGEVSIHAPREGRDSRARGGSRPRRSFNPRAP